MLKRTGWLTAILLIFTLYGCGPKPGATGSLVWPEPPELPRIKYVRTIASAEDIHKPAGVKLKEALLGEKTVDRVIKPYGVAVDSRGRLFVADGGNFAVLVFNENPVGEEKYLTYLGATSPGRLASPLDVCVDDSDFVYVSDVQRNNVFVYTPDLVFHHVMGQESTFGRPAGVAYNRFNDEIIVLDSKSHDVKFFDRDGTLLRTIGGPGGDNGYFNYPTNVACDPYGRIYIVDTMNFRIQIFDSEGNFLSTFGQPDNVPGSFSRPRGIALDSEGHIYVVDAAFSNIQIFQENGVLLLHLGSLGDTPGHFRLPAGLWFDKNDYLYVADQFNRRVQVFKYIRY